MFRTEDGNHQAGKASAAAEIEPAPGLRKERCELGAVGHMPAPDLGQGARRDQVLHPLPLGEERDIGGEPLPRFT